MWFQVLIVLLIEEIDFDSVRQLFRRSSCNGHSATFKLVFGFGFCKVHKYYTSINCLEVLSNPSNYLDNSKWIAFCNKRRIFNNSYLSIQPSEGFLGLFFWCKCHKSKPFWSIWNSVHHNFGCQRRKKNPKNKC